MSAPEGKTDVPREPAKRVRSLTHLGHRQHVLPFSAIAMFAVRRLIRREAIWNNYMPGREAEFETW
jgi:hypothetical protein